MSDFDRDPEALAWARSRVQHEIERMEDFMRQAGAKGDHAQMIQWRRHRNLLRRAFIGGEGCVIAAFDERLPKLPPSTRLRVVSDVGGADQ